MYKSTIFLLFLLSILSAATIDLISVEYNLHLNDDGSLNLEKIYDARLIWDGEANSSICMTDKAPILENYYLDLEVVDGTNQRRIPYSSMYLGTNYSDSYYTYDHRNQTLIICMKPNEILNTFFFKVKIKIPPATNVGEQFVSNSISLGFGGNQSDSYRGKIEVTCDEGLKLVPFEFASFEGAHIQSNITKGDRSRYVIYDISDGAYATLTISAERLDFLKKKEITDNMNILFFLMIFMGFISSYLKKSEKSLIIYPLMVALLTLAGTVYVNGSYIVNPPVSGMLLILFTVLIFYCLRDS
ncbi:MAG: hypothetical protein ABIJ10_05970 [Candidatus Micrarchaeota archaeon]